MTDPQQLAAIVFLGDTVQPADLAQVCALLPALGAKLAVHAMDAMRGCTCISLTGYGGPNDRAATREAGFAHHLSKPVNPVELIQLIESLPSRAKVA